MEKNDDMYFLLQLRDIYVRVKKCMKAKKSAQRDFSSGPGRH